MTKEDFIEIYKTYSVEALSEMLHDNIMMYEKKVDNLQKALIKKDEKIKNQAKHLQELQNKLNIANRTVSELMYEVERLIDHGIKSINKMDEMYESQMQVA
jgi:uncharacterized protein (DUF3084 family)